MRVPLLALTNDLTVKHVECCKQRGGAVALVVMRHRLRTPLLQRQAGLRAVQRLALFVAAQPQGVFCRRHVQAHDVFNFFDELGVTRDLQATYQVWLEAIGLPVPHTVLGLTSSTATTLQKPEP